VLYRLYGVTKCGNIACVLPQVFSTHRVCIIFIFRRNPSDSITYLW
jgi:hypothetical protein